MALFRVNQTFRNLSYGEVVEIADEELPRWAGDIQRGRLAPLATSDEVAHVHGDDDVEIDDVPVVDDSLLSTAEADPFDDEDEDEDESDE